MDVGVGEGVASFEETVVGALLVGEDAGLDELFCWGVS